MMPTPKILVVEDNPITRKAVRVALESRAMVVLEAPDAATALRMADVEDVDLILEDLALPDLDGFALLAKLRAIPRVAGVPVLAFSGFLSTAEESRVASAGFDGVITKPIDPSRLPQIILAHLPFTDVSSETFGKGRHLIVADDDAVQRKLTCFRLTRLGFETVPAEDGAAALALARHSAPDAILSDIMMPGLDGFGLCAAVRQDAALAELPIVLMTNSYIEKADRDLALNAGANECVLRTPEMAEIILALRTTLQGKGRRRVPVVVPSIALERERASRALNQLERQATLGAGLAQRCARLSAELSVLTGISGALTKRQDVDLVLNEILAACFDAGGISVGALYLKDEREPFRVLNFGGYAEWRHEEVRNFFGHPELLQTVMDTQKTLVLPSAHVPAAQARAFLERSQVESALIVPLGQGTAPLGALLMVSRTSDLTNEDRVAFAEGIANQISVALLLAHSFQEQDTSERKAHEQATVLRSVLDSLSDGVVVADPTGHIIIWNRAAMRITQLELAEGSLLSSLLASYEVMRPDLSERFPTEQMPIVRAMKGESVDGAEMFLKSDDPTKDRWVSVNARPLMDDTGTLLGGVAVFRDVTKEKSTQAQLMVADRMASIGGLAAGVGHEINNPLASVLANLEIINRDVTDLVRTAATAPQVSELLDALRDAREGAERVRQIVRDLKLFSRAEEEAAEAVDLQRVLESSLRMAGNEIRHRACLVKQYGEVPLVKVNESRLGQVFLNLIVNAAQAIPEGTADRNEIRVTTYTDPAGRAVIEIADTGEGISPEVMRRLFTPFFTTKAVGVGTGLGLSICQRLVTAAGGEIHVEKRREKGTLFRVVLPPAPPADLPAVESAVDAVRISNGTMRRGHVLVVDDERAIGQVVRRILGKDHEVEVMTEAGGALQRIVDGMRYDVILCDLMMPVMTGMELYTELQRTVPEQAHNIIFLTGGAFTTTARRFLDEVPNPRIEKPFNLQHLATTVNDRMRV